MRLTNATWKVRPRWLFLLFFLMLPGRLAQAQSTHGEDFDVVRTMSVPFTNGKDGSASADFLVPGMTAVGRIDLTSLNFADGSTWSIAADASCRVSPDLYMAVASR